MKFSKMTKKQQNRMIIRMQNKSGTLVKKAVIKAELLKNELLSEK